MYNPVNNADINTDIMKQHDIKEQNKKQRYKLRYDVEKYQRDKNVLLDLKKEKGMNNKLSYHRFKTQDNRGYDIINFDNKYEHYKNNLKLKDEKPEWDVIVNKAGGLDNSLNSR